LSFCFIFFLHKLCIDLYFLPCVLHAPPISSSLILLPSQNRTQTNYRHYGSQDKSVTINFSVKQRHLLQFHYALTCLIIFPPILN
jgi:hypothetical protein